MTLEFVSLLEKKFLNKNLGSAAVYAMVESLFEEQKIERIIAEPQADNWSAIISLQRARFRRRGRINRPGFNLVQLTFVRNFLIKKNNSTFLDEEKAQVFLYE